MEGNRNNFFKEDILKNSLIMGQILCFLAMGCSTLKSVVNPYILACGDAECSSDGETFLCTFDFVNCSSKKVVSLEFGFRIMFDSDFTEYDDEFSSEVIKKVEINVEPGKALNFNVDVKVLNNFQAENFGSIFASDPEVFKIYYQDGSSWICG